MEEFLDYFWRSKGFQYDPNRTYLFTAYYWVMIAIAIITFAVIWLIGTRLKHKRITLVVISLLLLFLEAGRVYNFMDVSHKDFIPSLSFHMCSIGVYLAIIAGIFQKSWMFDTLIIQSVIGAPLAVLIPSGILPWYYDYSFMPIQSILSHTLLFLVPVFAYKNGVYKIKLYNFYIPVISVLVSTQVAYYMSWYNYNNQTGGFANFFWTRYKETFFDQIWELPYPYYLIVVIGLFILTGFIAYLLMYLYRPQKRMNELST
jgi:uncharacterized membrane protein YwaF